MEFKTGSGWAQRRDWHTLQLARLAMGAGRVLHLVTRNRIEVLPRLVKIFHAVTVIDTTSFVATMKRRRAVRGAEGRLQFIKDDLRRGEPLDERLAHNVAVYGRWLEERMCRT
jgi:hypothetical protein